MKLLIILLLIVGCEEIKKIKEDHSDQQKEERQKSRDQSYEDKINKNLNSGIRSDDIFMTFKLGDSKEVVKNKFRQLEKDNILYLNKNNEYEYEMKIDDHTNTIATFSTKYHNDKLYHFDLMLDTKEDVFSKGTTLSIISFYLTEIYKQKYGSYDHLEDWLVGTGLNYYWIDNNREISIKGMITKIFISYIDKGIELEIDENKKEENKTKKKQLLDNI